MLPESRMRGGSRIFPDISRFCAKIPGSAIHESWRNHLIYLMISEMNSAECKNFPVISRFTGICC